MIVRRGAGVVDQACLESKCTVFRTQGSNPCLSAIFFGSILIEML